MPLVLPLVRAFASVIATRYGVCLLWISLACVAPSSARAQGFQLQQYEPVSAGDRAFVVAAPWYSDTRRFAAALTLNYGHDALQGGLVTEDGFSGTTIVDHQLGAHLDLAYAPLDRLQLSLSLPMTSWEDGQARRDVAPVSSPVIGDPRVGALVRLFGDAASDAVSAHLGGALWLPVGVEEHHAGDESARGRLSALFAGQVFDHLAWATSASALLRKRAGLNDLQSGPGTVGNELQLGASAGYSSTDRKLYVGPEAAFGTVLGDGRAFTRGGSHLELFLSGTYWASSNWQLGAALGAGVVRSPGTPDARGLLRIAYAPFAPSQAATTFMTPAPQPAAVTAPEPAKPPPVPAPEPVEPERELAEAPPPVEPPPVEPAPVPPPELPRIGFARGQATMTDTDALDDAAELLKAHPEITAIRVVGHSDDTGPAEYNQRLSLSRARYVAAQLQQRGVPADKFDVSGVGSSQPLTAATTEAARSENRRVEIQPITD